MTSREKRHLREQGIDWRDAERARIEALPKPKPIPEKRSTQVYQAMQEAQRRVNGRPVRPRFSRVNPILLALAMSAMDAISGGDDDG